MTATEAHERMVALDEEIGTPAVDLVRVRPRVLDLAPDYVAPLPRTITALGSAGLGNLNYALWSFHEGGQASDCRCREACPLKLPKIMLIDVAAES